MTFQVGDRVRVLRVPGAVGAAERCPFEAPIVFCHPDRWYTVDEPGVGWWSVQESDIQAIEPQVPLREEVVKRQILSLIRRDPSARVRLTDWLEGICAHCQNEDVVTTLDLGEEGEFCASCIESMVEEVKADRKFEESRA